MSITLYTVLWAILALSSIVGLFAFNQGRGFFVFITGQKYLFFFLVASLLGMREVHIPAVVVLGLTIFLMFWEYFPYVETCRRLKNMREVKH